MAKLLGILSFVLGKADVHDAQVNSLLEAAVRVSGWIPGIFAGFLGMGPDSWEYGEIPGTLRRLNGTLRWLNGNPGWMNRALEIAGRVAVTLFGRAPTGAFWPGKWGGATG